MKMAGLDVETLADVDTLAAVIAHSQIVVTAPARRFLADFDEVDIAILDWIIAESRLAGRRYLPM
jgi:hypothetical protein